MNKKIFGIIFVMFLLVGIMSVGVFAKGASLIASGASSGSSGASAGQAVGAAVSSVGQVANSAVNKISPASSNSQAVGKIESPSIRQTAKAKIEITASKVQNTISNLFSRAPTTNPTIQTQTASTNSNSQAVAKIQNPTITQNIKVFFTKLFGRKG